MAVSAALAFAATPAHSQSGESLELVPTGQWALDYGDDACTLSRRFTSSEGEVDLRIETATPGHNFALILTSGQLAGGRGPVRTVVGPNAEQRTYDNPQRGQEGSTNAVRFGDTLLPVDAPNAALSDAASIEGYIRAEANITNVVFTNAFERPVSLRLGSMVNPMTAMRSCVDDLLISWGMDPASAAAGTVPPVRVSQARWAQRVQEAFPRSRGRALRSGQVRVVMAISASGSVTHCHAHSLQSIDAIETVACQSLIAHARYEPARDATGNAVSGFDTMDIYYQTGP